MVPAVSPRIPRDRSSPTGALVVAAPLLPDSAVAQQAANSTGDGGLWRPSVYLGIEPNGNVKIVAHRSEMGTGCRTGLPMIVADELEADWSRVQIVQALGDVKYGSQNTDGSCSVRDFYDAMRAAGASARNMLEHAAAGKWGVPEEECQGQNHFVVHTKTQPEAVLRRAGSARLGLHRADAERDSLQTARAVPLYRQRDPDRRSEADHAMARRYSGSTPKCRAWCTRQSSGRRSWAARSRPATMRRPNR